MSAAPLVKIAASAADICGRFEPTTEARARLRDGMAPQDFVQALLDHNLYVAGIDFLAHALPPREAIWWGCLCVQQVYGDSLSPADRAAALAAVHWVLRPGEPARVAARQPAEAAGPTSAAGALAAAAFLTGGNSAPPHAPPSPPALFAPAQSVAKAVKIASIQGALDKIPGSQRAMFQLGICVAEGRYI